MAHLITSPRDAIWRPLQNFMYKLGMGILSKSNIR